MMTRRCWRAAATALTLVTLSWTVPPPSGFAASGGDQPVYAREVGFNAHFYYGSSGGADGQIEYICRAFPGTTGSDSTASSVWQVQRFSYNAGGQITDIEFAGDDDAFSFICDDRVSLDYD